MEMKYMIPALASLMVLSACDLSLMPETSYSEGNVEVSEETESQYNTREDIKGFSPDYFIISSRCIIAICLSCLIPLRWNLMRESIAATFKVEKMATATDIIVTVLGMIALNLIVYFVDILTIIGFIGGIVTFMISFVIPVFSYVKYIKKKSSDTKLKVSYVIFFVFMIIGTAATIKSIVDFSK